MLDRSPLAAFAALCFLLPAAAREKATQSTPPALPKGTRVEVASWLDTTERNPRNPNRPPRTVRFGENTTDEMSVAYLGGTGVRP